MTETGEPELTVYHRHLAQVPKRDAGENFRALLIQARHITGTSYETTLYDHQQAFRLLWRHLEGIGYLRRAHRDARARLTSGHAAPEERADLELFLTVYGQVHPPNVAGA
ncbi:hypothetical protein ADL25_24545 [Streptomyces sp. NRRL F-5122]|uniref:hypothetical protein n=1 Tax=Streptomyces sp. NRRL F-5122 TaxID=1609098 RepID=UPI000740D502|nr:hypothetical protein [Streptomyces sp. NRRL F-5122]KUJ38390.1 hypothetical protein ADL25_24545 [Streptomyces sp. NRRL F-5122]